MFFSEDFNSPLGATFPIEVYTTLDPADEEGTTNSGRVLTNLVGMDSANEAVYDLDYLYRKELIRYSNGVEAEPIYAYWNEIIGG